MSIANNITYVNTFIDYLQIAPVLVARSAGDYAALSHAASALKGRRTDRKIPFPNSKEIRRGEISKMQRVFLSGRSARLRALGGGLSFRHFAENRFELRCKNEPQ